MQMFGFWLMIAIMLMIAITFIIWSWLFKNKDDSPLHADANIHLYKQQLAQLDEDFAAGAMTPVLYQQMKQEIEQGVLQDVVHADSVSRSSLRGSLRPKQSSLLAIFLVLFIPIFSISIYLKLGDSNNLKKYYVESAHAAEINAEIKQFKSPQQLINKMLTVLQQHPNSAEGWFLLGRLYAGTEQLNLAEQAYTKAILFAPNHLNYKLQYAETDFFLNQQKLSKQAQEYLTEVIAKQPNNAEAINLAALAAYSSGNYQIAINNWEKLLSYFPASSSEGQVIMRAIHQAQLHIG